MVIHFLLFVSLYLLIELVYFRIAAKYNISDRPNNRSSHRYSTIRGGGIIFPISFGISLLIYSFPGWPATIIGLAIVSITSFYDDIFNLNNKIRLLIQGLSVLILLFQFELGVNVIIFGTSFIIITGTINAYNFMDGINGITALYSIVAIGTLFWLNQSVVTIVPAIFYLSLLASLLVFSFFNIRAKAKCFAGDVGSVSMSFIICFLLINLSVKTASFIWILLLGIYGIDTVFTIVCRLARKEPIFRAHRSHFYQFLVNEQGINPLIVASIYALAQLVLNVAVIFAYRADRPLVAVASLFVFILIYTFFRLRFEGRYRLFTAY